MVGLARRRPYLVAVVAVALLLTLLVGGRAAWRLGHRLLGPPPPPRQTDVSAIAGWMSVQYVGRAYGVPPRELYDALGVEPDRNRTTTLDDIASATGRSSDEVVATVRTTVAAWQATHPGPPRKPGDRPPDGPRPPP